MRTAWKKPTLPFVAKCGFGWQAVILVAWLLSLWLFLARGDDGQSAVFRVWEQGGIFLRIGILLGLVLIPGLPLEAFRARTVFAEGEIRHLPTFGRCRVFRYQDIVDLEVFPNEFARIEFRDGRKLKIWAMRADPRVVEGIVHARLTSGGIDNR